jgi:pimeloyl-ACP methyl ester carboxylesterase
MGKAGKLWKTLGAAGAGVAALAAVNARIRRQAQEPDDAAFGGKARAFEWRHGDVFYKEAGEGRDGAPIVFVHGVGAGASSFIWRRNFDELARDFRVLAPDLLGFGFSDKPATVPYSADLYVELLTDFLREVAGGGAHLVASSLGAAYCVHVAYERPELVRSLVLVAPTGAGGQLRARPGMTGAAFYGLLQSPVLGASFYNVIASERSIRDYARRELFYDRRRATPRLVAQYYATSHQPGAQHAIAAFLSGYLNTDTREAFARLRQPVTLVWGKQDETNPLEHAAELLSLNPRAGLEIFDRCRMMPQEEHPEKFNALVRGQLRSRSAAA